MYCATSREVAGSIPDGVFGIFLQLNPSVRTLALGSTQPLTEVSTLNISWGGKGVQYVRLATLPPSCADCLEILEPQTPETRRARPLSRHVQGLLYLYIYPCVTCCDCRATQGQNTQQVEHKM